MKVSLNHDKCLSAGLCVVAAPAVFDQRDEDGIAFVLQDNPSEDQGKAVRHAAALCPGLAITVGEGSEQ
ncbi:ferredoxin [Nocardioides sp. zg-579]|uniref:Ferredoxin n=1 Tax=Nocardioides marmotae TaxID=2663857 RepID=A0A6I3J8X0_9ACTN|nr:ferredoxin [Nocardioides marmotae]MCR6030099.1 ferredoxin [Gordonia jinghuaiqii]MTB93730.1 ferredoxin [Nocardioides marmotae]QKE00073.1 ferredoxin [Nocardioides marmotae]